MDKKWYESKTLWANGLMVLAAVLEASGVTNILTPEVQSEVVVVVMGVVNLVLRLMTNKAVTV